MKKQLTLTLIILILGSLSTVSAQNKNMSVTDFRLELTDMDAAANFPVKDQNGENCAIIKVENTEKGFYFEIGQLGVTKVDENHVAETWVYIPYGAMRISIQHPQLGRLEYEFPVHIEKGKVYRLVLSSKQLRTIYEETAGGQYLVLYTNPASAEITIDDQMPLPITNGEFSTFLQAGNHNYTVKSRYYNDYNKSVYVIDNETVKLTDSISLTPNFGYITFKSNVNAEVEINGNIEGTIPFTTRMLELGRYNVRVSADRYAPYEDIITLSAGADTLTKQINLTPYFSPITITSPMAEASIYINDELKGTGTWSGELMPATYFIKATREGYRESKKRITVTANTPQTITMDAPEQIFGKIKVDSPLGAEVLVDGEVRGTAPCFISDMSVGEHAVVIRKNSNEVATKVTVFDGKISPVILTAEQTAVITAVAPVAKAETPKETPKETKPKATRESKAEPTPATKPIAKSEEPKKVVKSTATTPTTPKKTVKSDDKGNFLFMAQVGYDMSDISFGAMVGWVKSNGAYLKLLSNFGSTSATYSTTDGDIGTSSVPSYDSEGASAANLAFTAGYIRRLTNPLYMYVGAGYGSHTLLWSTTSGDMVKLDDYCYTGVAADAGVILRLNSFAVSVGVTTINFKHSDVTLGLGFMF